ncbi:type III-A CRISPR-associated protein Csm2 [Benzoatithermus flavus]|uniref:CRISPR system Cms protein Csm2 n=1 Tax=Benzoatithermus flavus TaxID=3108223 RepID=A0ABU8XVQ5_9PROT
MRQQPPRSFPPPRGPGGSGGSRPSAPRGPSLEERLRSPETVRYYADAERKAIRRELLDGEAEAVARRLRSIPASQLRRFFGSVMTLKRRVELEKPPAELIQAEMALLKASAAYACKRGKYDRDEERDPDELLSFFVRHARSVRDAQDFMAFARHFEAVVAYHKCFEDKQRRD